MSPSYLLTAEIEESLMAFNDILSHEGLNASLDEEDFCFSGDLKVSF
ncbi:MAG: hypothetical protein WCN87_03485 [Chlamydiota bacterium]